MVEEKKAEYWDYLEADPDTCHGQLRFRGTRIMAYIILEALASGVTEEELCESYPSLTHSHIRAAVGYAAAVTRNERYVPLAG